MDIINSVANWPFLSEPLYRWMLFWFAIVAFMFAWNGVLDFMK